MWNIAFAQGQAVTITGDTEVPVKNQATIASEPISITHTLLGTSLYDGIHKKVQYLKSKQSKQPKSVSDSTQIFYVRNVLDQSKWDSIQVRKIYTYQSVSVWMERIALDTLQSSQSYERMIEQLNRYLFERTPKRSIRPDSGITDILRSYAGANPDVDGDGILDLVLLDIKDNFQQTGAYVAGFFDPVNIIDHPYSNRRDMIYLDLKPTIFWNDTVHVKQAAATFAHEAQHLIHAGYEGQEPEYVFLNEGYSEAMEILCGFMPRQAGTTSSAFDRSLLSWDFDNPLPDYIRAANWTWYLLEQTTPNLLPALIRQPLTGIDGINKALSTHSPYDFTSIFNTWGIALSLNDRRLDTRYGFEHPAMQGAFLQPSVEAGNLPYASTLNRKPLTHTFIDLPLAEQISFRAQTTTLQPHHTGFVSYPDGSRNVYDQGAQMSFEIQAGDQPYGSIAVLMSTPVRRYRPAEDTISRTYSWLARGTRSGTTVPLKYDDGSADRFYRNASYLTLDGLDDAIGIAFEAPEDSYWLQKISVNTLFRSELQGTGIAPDAERDFRIAVYPCCKSLPPETEPLVGSVVSVQRPLGTLEYETFSLADQYDDLGRLQDSILIVIRNDNDDDNDVSIALDSSGIANSYFSGNAESTEPWVRFSELTVGNANLKGYSPMIRAHAVVPEVRTTTQPGIITPELAATNVRVSVEPGPGHDTSSVRLFAHLPGGSFIEATADSTAQAGDYRYTVPLQLDDDYRFYARYKRNDGHQTVTAEKQWRIEQPEGFIVQDNYPNPFNHNTHVPLTLLEPGKVRWKVYDVLGRLVYNSDTGRLERGQFQLDINMPGAASGVYFLRLRYMRNRDRKTVIKHQKITLIK